ncbi:hypothetical protein GNP61_17000 [Aliivibrio fischeri]|nr:hypothetical protein [Aliivibrio fischeri]
MNTYIVYLEILRMHDRKLYILRWGLVIAYILLAVLIGNPEYTLPIWEQIKEIRMSSLSNTIAWLGVIAAGASAIATFLSFKVASSSRDIAHNALSFQYQDSIKESISLIVSTLVFTKTNSINVNNIVTTPAINYSLSTKRADWIFAAQEVENIMNLINNMSLNEKHNKRLIERYGRILHNQLCPTTYGKGTGIFTANKPDDAELNRVFSKVEKTIRDEDLFTIYLFTEQYELYVPQSGQYPVHNRCCYFHKNSNLQLS